VRTLPTADPHAATARTLAGIRRRIDSTNSSYGEENGHITHLGCNLAKNQYSVDKFEDWLAIITAPVVALPVTQAENA
jgi:hypothetical protein